LRQEISEAGSLTEAHRPQRREAASCPIHCPAAQQLLVPAAGENKVGPQEENASSERWKKQKLFQAILG